MIKNNAYIVSAILALTLTCSGCTPSARERGVILTVATYNVHHLRSSYHAVRDAIAAMNTDIVALQEMPVRGKIQYSEKLARDLGYRNISGEPYYRQGPVNGWVLTFLSKYPVILKEEKKLRGSRRALRIDIAVNNKPLTIITTHLSPFVWSRDPIRENRARSSLRKTQIDELIRWSRESSGRTIIMGDMNSIYLMGELTPFPQNKFTDVFDTSSTDCPGTFPLRPFMLQRIRKIVPFTPELITLDYIFVSPGIDVISAGVNKSSASDHYPVTAKLLLE